MAISKYIKISDEILIEYIYDYELNVDNYRVVVDSKNSEYIFLQEKFTDSVLTNSNNHIDYGGVILNKNSNQWTNYVNSQLTDIDFKFYETSNPIQYDAIKIHFSPDYNFKEYKGFALELMSKTYFTNKNIALSRFLFDKVNHFGLIQFNSKPFLFLERYYSKYIQVLVPSAYRMSLERLNSTAKPNTPNYYLTDSEGLSMDYPLMLNWSNITAKKLDNFNNEIYIVEDPIEFSYPNKSDYDSLAVNIKESTFGDYFEIFGEYEGSASGFKDFLELLDLQGQRSYVTYDINVYEGTILTNKQQFYKVDNFEDPIEYRPIIKNSSTTAYIDITLRVTSVDNNYSIIRRTTYTMLTAEVAKYGNKLTRINVDGVFKPKVYNSKGNFSTLNLDEIFGRSLQDIEIQYVPVLYESKNVVARESLKTDPNDISFVGMGALNIEINPFDNMFRFTIGSNVNSKGNIEKFNIPDNSDIKIQFKSNTKDVTISLYEDETNNLSEGVVNFLIGKELYGDLEKIYLAGYRTFFINLYTNNGNITNLYRGTFSLANKNINVSQS